MPYAKPDRRVPVTIYTHWQSPATGLIKPMRRVLTQADFDDHANTVAINTGLIVHQLMLVMVFNQPGLEYIEIHKWNSLAEDELEGYWSASFGTGEASILVMHEESHEFNWGDRHEVSSAEAAFIHPLTGVPNAARITGKPKDNRRSTPRTQHIELRC